jgi:hypothetical protein
VQARLQGSVGKQGELELGMIGRGMRLIVFLNNEHPVTTSKVVNIRMDCPKAAPPKSSSSIH